MLETRHSFPIARLGLMLRSAHRRGPGMAVTGDRTAADAEYAGAIRRELGAGTLGHGSAASRQRWRDEAERLERNVGRSPLADVNGDETSAEPSWRRLRYALAEDANLTEALMVVADDHEEPDGTVFTVRPEYAEAVYLDDDGGIWVRPEKLDTATADRMGIILDGSIVDHLPVVGRVGEAVVRLERVVADNGQRIQWNAEYFDQRAYGFTAEEALAELGYVRSGTSGVSLMPTSELVAGLKARAVATVTLDNGAGKRWSVPATAVAEWRQASMALGYSATDDELVADIELASGDADERYAMSQVNPEATRYDAALAAVRASAFEVEPAANPNVGPSPARALDAQDAGQFDAYAERASAQQRHPSMRGACGQIVKSTQMPCQLTAGHRGRCRSR